MGDDGHNNIEHHPFYSTMVHRVLSYSYTMFFIAIIIGIILNIIFPVRIFNLPIYKYGGLAMIMVGSWFVYWAQNTSGRIHKYEITEKYFEHGPYKYTRNPTHLGLSAMIIGLGFLLNAVFIVLISVFASLVTKFVFLKREEDLLERKYGNAYKEYKEKVKGV